MCSCLNTGIFHQFSADIQRGLLLVDTEDAPKTREANHELLELQRRCRESKAEILMGLNLEKTREHLLETTYYHKMYDSPSCWKGDVKVVDANFAELKYEAARLDALKENIWMRVKGCGWEKTHTTWSHKRIERTVKELVTHLKRVITSKMDQDVPEDSNIKVPERRNDASLGT